MSRCERVSWIVGDPPEWRDAHIHRVSGTQRVECRCATHDMPMGSPNLPGTELCPIGRIEEATETALARIETANGQHKPAGCWLAYLGSLEGRLMQLLRDVSHNKSSYSTMASHDAMVTRLKELRKFLGEHPA